jgi:hypothetical protein
MLTDRINVITCGRKWSWPNWKHRTAMHMEKLKKVMKNTCQDCRNRGRDLNRGPCEYRSEVIKQCIARSGDIAQLSLCIILLLNAKLVALKAVHTD